MTFLGLLLIGFMMISSWRLHADGLMLIASRWRRHGDGLHDDGFMSLPVTVLACLGLLVSGFMVVASW